MMVRTPSPPGNGGFDLGEPFDTRAALLIAHDDARKKLHRTQVDGDQAAIASAEWTVTERFGDLLAHEHYLSNARRVVWWWWRTRSLQWLAFLVSCATLLLWTICITNHDTGKVKIFHKKCECFLCEVGEALKLDTCDGKPK